MALGVEEGREERSLGVFVLLLFFFCFVFFAVQGEASLLSFGQNSAVWPHSRARGAGKDSLVISSRGTFLPQAGVSVPIL